MDFRSLQSLTSLNRAALETWASRQPTAQMVIDASSQFEHLLAARFDFKGAAGMAVVISKPVEERREGHVPAILKLLTHVVETLPSPLTGSILINLEDGMWQPDLAKSAPVLSFGRNLDDPLTIMLPDPAFLDSKGYEEQLAFYDAYAGHVPWEARRHTLFWRGASSGCAHYGENWIATPRVRVALLSRDTGRPDLFDAAITKVVDYHDERSSVGIPKLGIVSEPVPFERTLHYRYALDVDGEHCTWMSCFQKLASGSVLFKVEGPWCQWYYDRIVPWQHFIPVKNDLSDLLPLIEWARAHDAECRDMALRAREVIRGLSYQNVLGGMVDLIDELCRLQVQQ